MSDLESVTRELRLLRVLVASQELRISALEAEIASPRRSSTFELVPELPRVPVTGSLPSPVQSHPAATPGVTPCPGIFASGHCLLRHREPPVPCQALGTVCDLCIDGQAPGCEWQRSPGSQLSFVRCFPDLRVSALSAVHCVPVLFYC